MRSQPVIFRQERRKNEPRARPRQPPIPPRGPPPPPRRQPSSPPPTPPSERGFEPSERGERCRRRDRGARKRRHQGPEDPQRTGGRSHRDKTSEESPMKRSKKFDQRVVGRQPKKGSPSRKALLPRHPRRRLAFEQGETPTEKSKYFGQRSTKDGRTLKKGSRPLTRSTLAAVRSRRERGLSL